MWLMVNPNTFYPKISSDIEVIQIVQPNNILGNVIRYSLFFRLSVHKVWEFERWRFGLWGFTVCQRMASVFQYRNSCMHCKIMPLLSCWESQNLCWGVDHLPSHIMLYNELIMWPKHVDCQLSQFLWMMHGTLNHMYTYICLRTTCGLQ